VIDAHKLTIHQERVQFKKFKSETEASIAGLKEEILQKQIDIQELEARFVRNKFASAVDHHHMKDEQDDLRKKLVGEKLMHGADHAQEEDIISSQNSQIRELEESIQAFREKVSGLEDQLGERTGSLEHLTKDYNTSRVEWTAKSKLLTNQLKSKSSTIAEKESMLSDLSTTLLDKDTTIQEKERALEGLGIDLSTANKTLGEKEDILKEFGERLNDQSTTLASKTALIEERENKIAMLTESQNAANKSIVEKQRQLDDLNAAVRQDRDAHNAAKDHFEASIEEMKQRAYEASEEADDYKRQLEIARENGEELTELQAKYNECVHTSSLAESQLNAARTNLDTLSSTKEELEAKLESAERELKTAERRDKQGKAATVAAQAVSLLQVASIERAEEEAGEKGRQLEEAEKNLANIKQQMESCKQELEGKLDKTSAGYLQTKQVLSELKGQFEETTSFADEKKRELGLAEAKALEIQKKLEERADNAEKRANEINAELQNLLEKGEEEDSQEEVTRLREMAQEAQSKAAFLSTQLDMIGKREDEIQAAKDEAEANAEDLQRVVNDLREQVGSSGGELLEAEEALRKEKERVAAFEGSLKAFSAKEEENLVMFKKLQDELERREVEHRTALDKVAKEETASLNMIKGELEASRSEAEGVKGELEKEAKELSEKVVEISKQFLDNKDEGIIARKR
jgi:chromosome segregation ATPase